MSKFGWCLDNKHDLCRHQNTHLNVTLTCSCDCHDDRTED